MGLLNINTLQNGYCYAIDTVAFIYFLEHHPQYFPTARSLFTKIERGEIKAVISTLVFAELLIPAYKTDDSKLAEKIQRTLSNFPNLEIVPVSANIATTAAQLRSEHNLRTPDAIHAATAFAKKTNGIITNDKDFQRLSSTDFNIRLFNI